ncbi:MAG: hypothetical protein EBS82_03345 [Methylocystaceae bacterium]|nr:hypothetical protein [Methylocystaceae bacterium]NBT96347.1 hypothetical protein [Methylocystaceae bacterium]
MLSPRKFLLSLLLAQRPWGEKGKRDALWRRRTLEPVIQLALLLEPWSPRPFLNAMSVSRIRQLALMDDEKRTAVASGPSLGRKAQRE